MAKYIGETTEYDKKQEVERRKVKKLAEERQRHYRRTCNSS